MVVPRKAWDVGIGVTPLETLESLYAEIESLKLFAGDGAEEL
jgi:hypothetical protein